MSTEYVRLACNQYILHLGSSQIDTEMWAYVTLKVSVCEAYVNKAQCQIKSNPVWLFLPCVLLCSIISRCIEEKIISILIRSIILVTIYIYNRNVQCVVRGMVLLSNMLNTVENGWSQAKKENVHIRVSMAGRIYWMVYLYSILSVFLTSPRSFTIYLELLLWALSIKFIIRSNVSMTLRMVLALEMSYSWYDHHIIVIYIFFPVPYRNVH